MQPRGSKYPIRSTRRLATVWPLWLPFSRRIIERDLARRRVLTTPCWVGSLVTVLVERDALTSVWCFFAAILSGLMVAVSREQRSSAPSLAAHSPR
jgi:hypothetical protein